jgi:hypothetical protein
VVLDSVYFELCNGQLHSFVLEYLELRVQMFVKWFGQIILYYSAPTAGS